ncbi:MAG TPA: arginine--tRNA ligase [Kiritimatiellia bacterium]|nr:arginine--tRNA ligase [Kiritimatiellia bacterium]HRZ12591.1 arginine--tRNA ligase [Kiritimatiellia bacterium]HSA17669.1 arginine--tRNA ligase [Kiritimatiellia bacterium]
MQNDVLTIEQVLSDWARGAFQAAFPDSIPDGLSVGVVPTADERFGDYQCNAAMSLAKALKKPPREIASALAAAARPEAVAKAEVAGPGFVNLFLDPAWMAGRLEQLGDDPRLGVPGPGRGRTVVIDYSSPNVAKPMHIGHIRSTVIGNALDRLHRFLGWRVIADNHLGDWGTQFGLLIMGFRHFADPAAYETAPIEELERIYVKSYERSKEDPAWLDAARAELVKLQQGDPENRRLWQSFVEHSLREFNRIYERLGVSFDLVRGESHYNDRLPGVIERLEEKALARESEGALVVFLDDEKMPVCIVRKSDGAYNYATTDLATVAARAEEFAPDAVIYVTDERQQLHFRQIFAIAKKMGVATRLVHVWFGLMRLPEGTFSTRQGNVIKLERLLDEAQTRALAVVKAASPEMPAEQQGAVARAVGIGAVKYADLSQNPQSLVTFTWEKALALDGNSAPYLQYACARIASVLDKYRERFPGQDPAAHPIRLTEPIERRLAVRLLRFPEAVVHAAEAFKPNLLADYLYDLAQTYSTFYQNVPFLKAEAGPRESRVRLCELTMKTLRQGLSLLGIETPERI